MLRHQGIYNQLLFEKRSLTLTVITLQSPFMYYYTLLPAVSEYVLHILIGQNGNVAQLLMVIQTLFGLIFFKDRNVLSCVCREKIIVVTAKLSALTGKKLKWSNRMHIRQPSVGDLMKSAIPSDTRFIFLPVTLYKLAKIGERNSNDKQLLRNE